MFDRRYLLLASKERKQVFDQYVKERADEERKEKVRKLRQRKDDFRQLLIEAKLRGRYGRVVVCNIVKHSEGANLCQSCYQFLDAKKY